LIQGLLEEMPMEWREQALLTEADEAGLETIIMFLEVTRVIL
jgi:hypothetical protein